MKKTKNKKLALITLACTIAGCIIVASGAIVTLAVDRTEIKNQSSLCYEFVKENEEIPSKVERLESDLKKLEQLPEKVVRIETKVDTIIEILKNKKMD